MLSSRFAVAVHVMALQALNDEGPLTSHFIAGSVNTNPVVVRRLLGLLRQAGLVEVQAGARGGTRLARPAERIPLSEIYRAVEGSGCLLTLHKRAPNDKCPVGKNIGSVLAAVFGEAERALGRVLERTSLAVVAGELRRCVATGARKGKNG